MLSGTQEVEDSSAPLSVMHRIRCHCLAIVICLEFAQVLPPAPAAERPKFLFSRAVEAGSVVRTHGGRQIRSASPRRSLSFSQAAFPSCPCGRDSGNDRENQEACDEACIQRPAAH